MVKNAWCQVSNCKNKLTGKGRICGTHRWRKSKYGTFDLPDYKGIPNYLPEFELPDGILKLCPTHGELTKDGVYAQFYRGRVGSYNCRECMLGNNIRRNFKGLKNMADYDRMLQSQNGVCGMCKGQNNTTRNGKIKRFNIDHCHQSGKVRGLLCSFCNSLLGYAKDSIQTLKAAIEYLETHSVA